MTRAELDQIAWKSIHDRPPYALSGFLGTRARNYREIEEKLQDGVEFYHAWSDFLHAF